jgi:hypothetical protein
MNLTALIIQLVAGALGGNAVGNVAKDVNLGPVGNSIAGALGGGIGGQVLSSILGIGGAAAASGLDIGPIVSARRGRPIRIRHREGVARLPGEEWARCGR